MSGFVAWVDVDELRQLRADAARVAKLEQENKALWAMVDDFNEAVKRAAARLP